MASQPELRKTYADDRRYYRALVGKHVLFYRIEADAALLVVRVLHAAMLPELHLPSGSDD